MENEPGTYLKNIDRLSDLVWLDSPESVFDETQLIMKMVYPDFNSEKVIAAFNMVVDLFHGDFPGYRACNTEYHDLDHTIDTFLAMVRLVHGAVLNGLKFSQQDVAVGFVAALLHDAGYIQADQDRNGTGAKYTVEHVQRSIGFLKQHGKDLGLSEDEISAGCAEILCTDLAVDLEKIDFPSKEIELLGKMLGTADLLAQMSDRIYLEKLLLLYREFREAQVGNYDSEADLLKNTVVFFDLMADRFEKQLDGAVGFMRAHFASRWDIDRNLYLEAILKQKNYLSKVLMIPGADPLTYLNRSGIAERIKKNGG